MHTLVKSPDDFTPRWLTNVLSAAGQLKSGEVTSLGINAIGTGQMGSVVRLTPTYSSADAANTAPRTLICKLASPSEISRKTGIALGVYEAEVRFYQQVANTVAMRTPHCWLAEYDAVEGWFTLLLEDLEGYQPGDIVAGGSIERARLALEQLAHLQSSRWNDARLHELSWLASGGSLQALFSQFPQSLPGFIEKFGPHLEADLVDLAQRVTPRAMDYIRCWAGPSVVQHGDYRLDNMLFGMNSQHSPVVVVDWQTVRLGPPLVDAAFYLGAGLAPEQRRQHEEALMREYHDRLVSAGVRDFSWQTCWRDYRLHALYGFLMAVGTSVMVEQNARGMAMFKASVERHGRHALDMNCEALLK